MEMTWEQKFAAIGALGDASLRMREPGNWYVYQPAVDAIFGEALSMLARSGETPLEAVSEYWESLTHMREGACVVINHDKKRKRREVRWNGYMWQDYAPEAKGDEVSR